MLRKKLFALLSATALLGLFHSAVLPAGAQATPPANPLAGFNLPPSLFFGMMGQMGGGVDPTHSAAMQLLQRQDVRNEIGLDLKQQVALDDLRTKSTEEFQTAQQSSIQNTIKSLKDVPPEQMQEHIQGLMDQAATTIQNFQSDQDKRTEALLRPKQLKRLHELDLQWRTLLALSDPKVAESLKLIPDQSSKVGAIVKDFMDVQQKVLMQALVPTISPNGVGQDNGAASPQDRVLQMQKKINDAIHTKEMEKTKAEAEAKLRDLLTPTQKEQWTTMKGAKFSFRQTDVP